MRSAVKIHVRMVELVMETLWIARVYAKLVLLVPFAKVNSEIILLI